MERVRVARCFTAGWPLAFVLWSTTFPTGGGAPAGAAPAGTPPSAVPTRATTTIGTTRTPHRRTERDPLPVLMLGMVPGRRYSRASPGAPGHEPRTPAAGR